MFAELTDEVPDGTASTPTVLFLEPDQGVHPLSQALPGAEFSKQLSLAAEDRVVSRFGNSAKQVGLVVEVVVELAARRCGASADLIQLAPTAPFSATTSAAASTIRCRVRRPRSVVGCAAMFQVSHNWT